MNITSNIRSRWHILLEKQSGQFLDPRSKTTLLLMSQRHLVSMDLSPHSKVSDPPTVNEEIKPRKKINKQDWLIRALKIKLISYKRSKPRINKCLSFKQEQE